MRSVCLLHVTAELFVSLLTRFVRLATVLLFVRLCYYCWLFSSVLECQTKMLMFDILSAFSSVLILNAKQQ